MSRNFKERYRLWKKWQARNLNGQFYKILVLIGLASSPTFEAMPDIEAWEKANEE